MLIKPSVYLSFKSMFIKEILSEWRGRFAISSLFMFSFITLSGISVSVCNEPVAANIAAVILWLVILFSAMIGLSRAFAQEQDTGTLPTLRIYARPQAVLFAKLLVNVLLLLGASLMIVPLFTLFFGIDVVFNMHFCIVMVLGAIGFAIITTMTAALTTHSQNRSSMIIVLTFPILLPHFIGLISATAIIFSGSAPDLEQVIFLLGYDIVSLSATAMLFDYVWY